MDSIFAVVGVILNLLLSIGISAVLATDCPDLTQCFPNRYPTLYQGTFSQTTYNDVCYKWNSQEVISKLNNDFSESPYTENNFTDGKIDHNYCRKPLNDNISGNLLWCWCFISWVRPCACFVTKLTYCASDPCTTSTSTTTTTTSTTTTSTTTTTTPKTTTSTTTTTTATATTKLLEYENPTVGCRLDCGEGNCLNDTHCDYCRPNQCFEGVCVPIPSVTKDDKIRNFSCKCNSRYRGDYCRDLDDDPCRTDPSAKCKNGGKCVVKEKPGANDWLCLCPGGPKLGQANYCSEEKDSLYPIPEKTMKVIASFPFIALGICLPIWCVYDCISAGEVPPLDFASENPIPVPYVEPMECATIPRDTSSRNQPRSVQKGIKVKRVDQSAVSINITDKKETQHGIIYDDENNISEKSNNEVPNRKQKVVPEKKKFTKKSDNALAKGKQESLDSTSEGGSFTEGNEESRDEADYRTSIDSSMLSRYSLTGKRVDKSNKASSFSKENRGSKSEENIRISWDSSILLKESLTPGEILNIQRLSKYTKTEKHDGKQLNGSKK